VAFLFAREVTIRWCPPSTPTAPTAAPPLPSPTTPAANAASALAAAAPPPTAPESAARSRPSSSASAAPTSRPMRTPAASARTRGAASASATAPERTSRRRTPAPAAAARRHQPPPHAGTSRRRTPAPAAAARRHQPPSGLLRRLWWPTCRAHLPPRRRRARARPPPLRGPARQGRLHQLRPRGRRLHRQGRAAPRQVRPVVSRPAAPRTKCHTRSAAGPPRMPLQRLARSHDTHERRSCSSLACTASTMSPRKREPL
jgi:hypothetical protein